MTDPVLERLSASLSSLEGVRAVALSGSRAAGVQDEASDYDVYVYYQGALPATVRREQALRPLCSRVEAGNAFWESEDNCILNHGVPLDVIYRNIEGFAHEVADVVENCQARNAYTTCLWHNLLHSSIIFDPQGELAALVARFKVPYPERLRVNIVKRACALLYGYLPNYASQLNKACERGDLLSVGHRTTAFIETLTDLLFAFNRLTHPGEKRLLTQLSALCSKLPEGLEDSLKGLLMLPERPQSAQALLLRLKSSLYQLLEGESQFSSLLREQFMPEGSL